MEQKITCSKCGAENNAGTQYCLYCGAILQDNCPNCGSVVSPMAKFCSTCGTGLGWGLRIKEVQQQISQTEGNVVAAFHQQSQDIKNSFAATGAELKNVLSSYSNDFLAQQSILTNTTSNIQRLVREEHRMSQARTLNKIGLALMGVGLAVIGASYVLTQYSFLALAGLGIILIGFILQFISAFYPA